MGKKFQNNLGILKISKGSLEILKQIKMEWVHTYGYFKTSEEEGVSNNKLYSERSEKQKAQSGLVPQGGKERTKSIQIQQKEGLKPKQEMVKEKTRE